ncbi:MAG: undecaprenyl-diphosphate phosphatase [Chitinispirillaceae bacterium]|nr:undecaprenyl-diphosphate phosphatase [Chitinispirillaceae bacterium]
MTGYLETIFLGILQGVTEFLPVSSSGHLVLAQHLFGVKEGALFFDIILHVASALAVLFVFRKDIASLVCGSIASDRSERTAAWRYLMLLIIASIPAGVAGVMFKDFFEGMFSNTRAVGVSLLCTAVLLFLTLLRKKEGNALTVLQALAIGLAQAVAIMPGISRSGSTIAIALIIGVGRREAGKFSFFLALPAILGAAALHLKDVSMGAIAWGPAMAGFAASLAVSIIALQLLLWFIRGGKLYYFGFYCVAVGAISLVLIQ